MSVFNTTGDGAAYTVSSPAGRTLTGRTILCGLVFILGLGFGLQYASARMVGLSGIEPMGALLLIHVGLGLLFVAVLVLIAISALVYAFFFAGASLSDDKSTPSLCRLRTCSTRSPC